jgi:hypothetical protein
VSVLKLIKKKLVLRIPKNADVERFLDAIMGSTIATQVMYRIKGNSVEIRIIGDPVSVENSIHRIRSAVEDFAIKMGYPKEGRGITVFGSMLAKSLEVPVPLEGFKRLLELENIDFSYDEKEDLLVIYDDLEELKSLAKDLFDSYKSAREIARGIGAEIIAVLSVYSGLSPMEIASIGEEEGVFEKIEDMYMLKADKDKALNTIIEALKKKNEY